VWVAGKLCDPSIARAIPERIRGDYGDALYKSTFTFTYFTIIIKARAGDFILTYFNRKSRTKRPKSSNVKSASMTI